MVIGFAFEKSWLSQIRSGGFEKIRAAILYSLAAIWEDAAMRLQVDRHLSKKA